MTDIQTSDISYHRASDRQASRHIVLLSSSSTLSISMVFAVVVCYVLVRIFFLENFTGEKAPRCRDLAPLPDSLRNHALFMYVFFKFVCKICLNSFSVLIWQEHSMLPLLKYATCSQQIRRISSTSVSVSVGVICSLNWLAGLLV